MKGFQKIANVCNGKLNGNESVPKSPRKKGAKKWREKIIGTN